MANHGQSIWRPVKRRPFREVGPRSTPGHNPGGANQNHRFLSLSGTVRGARLHLTTLCACGRAAHCQPQCGWSCDNASPPRDAATKCQAPWKSGHLHDSRVPPDRQCMRFVEPQLNNSTGGSSFAACPEELCTRCHVRGHQGCEGHRPCQDPPGSRLATPAGYGHGRQGASL